ncbi:Hint domain-containing protein [Yoonia litorea]|uniref:Hint domain-containing protein n=1 Tax=Yoonia litorea TaxID=1123755 RepID=A0A1I6MB79_9RHOB|nr:Hint domain-containing protein [Yoonia litorea]SFS12848.1 Hint domain-containing protein [Yoonia litorea]
MADFDTRYFARVDQPTAGNAALNLKKLSNEPVIEIEFVPLSSSGDLTLETDGDPLTADIDPDTRVNVYEFNSVTGEFELVGTYTFIYEFTGALPTNQSSGAGFIPNDLLPPAVPQPLDATVVTIIGYNGDTRAMFLPDFDATLAQMEGFKQGRIDLDGTNTTNKNVCFVKGVLLETPHGSRKVEDLTTDDVLLGRDGNHLPIAWIGRSSVEMIGFDLENKPVLFSQGCLGPNSPQSELAVSPQHHLVLSGDIVRQIFEADEVLAPAKGLTGLPGVRVMKGKRSVEYYHVMLARHEIITAQGIQTESFYPGPTAVRMLTPAQRASLFAVVPPLKDDPENGYGPTARKKITRREAERLVEAILADRKAKAIAAE